ncbi:hypothetical protein EV102420_11_00260 [Pseudescherichia vulneris NBRC 102420]|uniref:Uncharacterized protein n=1 Tax=Pseudescherichia vulneris NBRC 102420 TaxID=1115515 RepID=A0A090V0X7_PSEVU|nr:hypothetical protein [Pseudescherichia vulneris]GAL58456.1 hypothetical protein EV102420_11_00260 [Pseudescherichia vulneris NBRC 102420]STQ60537.1 Uncharacterised protein [Pseudescherichia vulneris]
MEEIIVTIIGSNFPAMSASKFYDEEDDVEYIEIKGDGISQELFKNISQGTSVELYSELKSLGFYTLITATADMVLLAKGDIANLLKRKINFK